jgi:hypothetical protein
MQGFAILSQLGMSVLNGFGLTSMFQAFIGGGLFLILLGIAISFFKSKS